MNFFGIGTWELLIIAVGALLIFGPGKLPEVMGQVGKAVRDFRRMTSDLQGEFEKAVGDPNDIKRALTGEIDSVKSTVSGATSSVKRDLNQVSTTVGKTVSGAAKTASSTASTTATKSGASTTSSTKPASASAKPATGTTSASKTSPVKPAAPPKATKTDPLADVLLFESDEGSGSTAAAARMSSETVRSAGGAAPTASRPTAVPATPAGPASANGSAASSSDAFARARERRRAASYGSASHLPGESK
jgi:TatA/E family protein of Tat protein translocase